jgi:hypothetical protein
VPRRTDGATGFFLMSNPEQVPEIAVIKKPANHVRWDLARALLVKLMS